MKRDIVDNAVVDRNSLSLHSFRNVKRRVTQNTIPIFHTKNKKYDCFFIVEFIPFFSLSFPILTSSFNACVKVRCLETFQKECSERQGKASQNQCKAPRYDDWIFYTIVHHNMHTSNIMFRRRVQLCQ